MVIYMICGMNMVNMYTCVSTYVDNIFCNTLQHTATHCNTQNMIYMICVDIHDAHSEFEGDWQGGLRCGCVSFFLVYLCS